MAEGEPAVILPIDASEIVRIRHSLAEALRQIGAADEAESVVARTMVEGLRVDRAHYAEVDDSGTYAIVRTDFHAGGPSGVGRHRLDDYGSTISGQLRRGLSVVIEDSRRDERIDATVRARFDAFDIRAALAIPLIQEGSLVALLALHQKMPRRWSDEEIAFVEEAAERTWSAVIRARAESEKRESEDRYRALFHSIDHGFCVIELLVDETGVPNDYRILEGNPQFSDLTGFPVDGGRTVYEMMPTLERAWLEVYSRVALSRSPERLEMQAAPMDKWFDVYAFPVGDGTSLEVGVLFSDITERWQNDRALRESEERYRLVSRATNDAIWDRDLVNGTILWSGAVERVFGAPEDGVPQTTEWWSQRIHPDDSRRVLRGLKDAVSGSVESWSETYRIRRADGSFVTVYDRGLIQRVEGQAVRMIGSMLDLTDRLEAERALNDQTEVTRTITDNASTAIFLLDSLGRTTFVNPAAEVLLGYSFEELEGRVLHDAIHHTKPDGSFYPFSECPIGVHVLNGEVLRDHEDLFFRKDGSSFPVRCSASPLLQSGEIAGVVLEVRGIGDQKVAEEALRTSVEKYRTLFESIDEGFCIFELLFDEEGRAEDYRFVEINPAFERHTGMANAVGKTMRELVPGIEPVWFDIYSEVYRSGEPRRFVDFARAMGRWFDVYAFRIGDPAQRHIAVLFTDITETRRSMQALRESEQRLRLALEAAHAGTFEIWTDPEVPATVSSVTSELFGFEPGELRNVSDYLGRVHPEDREGVARVMEDARTRGLGHYIEYRIVRPDGSTCWVGSRAHVIPDAEGNTARLVGILIDISARREAERAVRESSELIQTVFENATSALIMMDEDGYCTFWNRAWQEMTGYEADDFGSKPLHDLVHHHYPDGRPYPREECPIDRALPENSDLRAHEDLFFRKDGSSFPVLCAANPIFKDGKPISTVIEVRDVSESKAAEQDLREREEQFRNLANTMPQLVWISRYDGTVTYYNSRVAQFDGFSQAEDGSWSWQPVLHPDDRERTVEAWQRAIATSNTYQCQHRVRMADGTFRWYLSRANLVQAGSVEQWYGTATDIHDMVQAETALRESEERFRTMADGMPLVVWVHDAEGRQKFVNATFCDYFGAGQEEASGDRWHGLLHPDDAPAYLEAFYHAVRGRKAFWSEARMRRSDGEWRWLESWGRPRFSAEGDYLGLIGASADVTDRKFVEQRIQELNETLETLVEARTADLLSANEQLQGFTYSVAHDLRQQIRGINANASILLLDAGESLDETSRQTLLRLVGSSKRLATLVDDLLAYARLGKQEPTKLTFDLSALAQEVAAIVIERGVCRQGTRFNIHPGMSAHGDASMVRLVLENLLDNACKYSKETETPHIEVGKDERGFFVRDNGIGFDMQYAHKLFEPFERLHREGEYSGTGIGLANVKRIVEKHGGTVWAESSVDMGATFFFELP
jgi:PAS domain S-box-containing protein